MIAAKEGGPLDSRLKDSSRPAACAAAAAAAAAYRSSGFLIKLNLQRKVVEITLLSIS